MTHTDIINVFKAIEDNEKKSMILEVLAQNVSDGHNGHMYIAPSTYLINFAQNAPVTKGMDKEEARRLMESYFNQWF